MPFQVIVADFESVTYYHTKRNKKNQKHTS